MLFLGESITKHWFFWAVLVSWIYEITTQDKTLNFRVGFDLTRGRNGAPSLQIREFDDSREYVMRATEDTKIKKENSSPAIRADSSDSSSDSQDKTRDDNKDAEKTTKSDIHSDGDSESDISDGSGSDSHRSTRGLNPEEYEPEDRSSFHKGFNKHDPETRYRHKRGAGKFEVTKKKSKRLKRGRKITKPYQ